MKTKRERKPGEASLAHALGASRVARIKERKARGPLEWLEMGQTLQDRLVSRGGRPSGTGSIGRNPHRTKCMTLRKTKRTMVKTNRKMGGFDKFLKESLAEDPQFKALFKKELEKVPAASARRAVRRLGLDLSC